MAAPAADWQARRAAACRGDSFPVLFRMDDWSPTTGCAGLDALLTGLRLGDNVVWRTDSLASYRTYVEALARGAGPYPVHYFRFAAHAAVLGAGPGVQVHALDPEAGFEDFIARVHAVIEPAGARAYHVFDCLSDLAADWYSDTMLGSFFQLTCPFVLHVGSIAYFSIRGQTHGARTLDLIQKTAQIVIDLYPHRGALFLHPIKVDQRHTPSMHLLHQVAGDRLVPVNSSAVTTEVLQAAGDRLLAAEPERAGVWQRTFREAEQLFAGAAAEGATRAAADAAFDHLLRMTVARDGPMLELARRHLRQADVLRIGRRLVGTGLIGGKAVGMLLARAILEQADPRWHELLEPHDSFFVGSDVFYTFLVENDVWWIRQQLGSSSTWQADAEEGRRRILRGAFSAPTEQQLGKVLDYLGQSPFIVRSSSLLEDNFGNAFSGKYESAFCTNQGERAQRLQALLDAVRRIYASSMAAEALHYRRQRGLLAHDEQMALLIQRVSGSLRGHRFYPDLAGVGLSHNPYVWHRAIDPRAGLVRLVYGLGTRAVERADDDYTRIVALGAPELRPEATLDQVRRYAQHRVDVLDLQAGELRAELFPSLLEEGVPAAIELSTSRDHDLERQARQRGQTIPVCPVLTFDGLLRRTSFAADMRALLRTLEQAYRCPVDIEFTANVGGGGGYRLNLLQCRPLQVREGDSVDSAPPDVPPERVLLASRGPVIGRSRRARVDRIVYVDPAAYSRLPQRDRYAAARLLGRVVHASDMRGRTVALIGPGRWGTSTPSLGVPVSFAEIDAVAMLCEVAGLGQELIPDVSLGTHFFNDLIEADILYVALFLQQPGAAVQQEALSGSRNLLGELIADATGWQDLIRVVDPGTCGRGRTLVLHADSLAQQVLLYWPESEKSA